MNSNYKINGELYFCKQLRKMTWLKNHGFNYIRIDPDNRNPNFDNWVYNNSEELQKCVDDYYNRGIAEKA